MTEFGFGEHQPGEKGAERRGEPGGMGGSGGGDDDEQGRGHE